MKSRWKLNAHFPSWVDSLNLPFNSKALTSQHPFPATSKPVLNHADLSSLLSICGRERNLNLGSSIHARIIKQPPSFDFDISPRNALFVWNSLLSMYSKCGQLRDAVKLFDRMPVRDAVSWNSMISGFLKNADFYTAFNFFKQMRVYCPFDKASLTTMFSACDGLEFSKALREGCKIHGLLWKLGMQSDLCIESALMDLYSKCGSLEAAWQIFDSAEDLDGVSLTVILVAFAQNGYEEEAIQIFTRMVALGVEVDANMVSAVLGVFGVGTSLALGKQIHSITIKKNFSQNPFVGNGLINMYSKCGDLYDSLQVFHQMTQKNSISWNSVIAAFARHGDGLRALQFFEEMRVEGRAPTDVTFLSLLHACSHAGLVAKGMELLECMTRDHGINPRSEHYACVVDMLGRAGHLKEAKEFIEGLPEHPGVLVWQALLGACSLHGDSEMGKYAAGKLFSAAPASPAPYILMANIYSTEGKWKERASTIKRMKEMGVAKEVGISWIEIEKKVNSFVVGDKLHPQADIIFWVLSGLLKHLKDEGYVPDKRN